MIGRLAPKPVTDARPQASGPTPALVWSMYADCADYGEWKTGRRTTALIFSTVQFSQKFGLAVGAGLAGIMLSWFGFVANEVQSESSMFGIRFMFSVVPAVFAMLNVLAIYFYRLDSTTVDRIEHELAERRDAVVAALGEQIAEHSAAVRDMTDHVGRFRGKQLRAALVLLSGVSVWAMQRLVRSVVTSGGAHADAAARVAAILYL